DPPKSILLRHPLGLPRTITHSMSYSPDRMPAIVCSSIEMTASLSKSVLPSAIASITSQTASSIRLMNFSIFTMASPLAQRISFGVAYRAKNCLERTTFAIEQPGEIIDPFHRVTLDQLRDAQMPHALFWVTPIKLAERISAAHRVKIFFLWQA